MAIRSAHLMQRTGDAIQEDIQEAVDHLMAASRQLKELEPVVRGINGASGTLRGKASEAEHLAAQLQAEAKDLRRKLMPSTYPIREEVNPELAEAVAAARA